MPRKNIFAYEKLTIDHNLTTDKNYFALLKGDNPSGSKYDYKRIQALKITIEKEIEKTNHEMNYKLREFVITPNAREALDLEQKVTDK